MAAQIWVNIGYGNGLLPDIHQAICWTNVDFSLVRSSNICLRAISQEITKSSVTKISLKFTCLKFHWNLPGSNELILWNTPSFLSWSMHHLLIIPPASMKGSILVSLCPSFHRIVSALYLQQYLSDHFIFAHLIKQLQNMWSINSLCQNSKIRNFGKFFKFVTLTLSSCDLGCNITQ